MRPMKLPGLVKRSYGPNKAGETWIGYYFQAARGADGMRPTPIALGSHLVKGKGPHSPPADVLLEYGKVAVKRVELPTAQGTVQATYDAYLAWARAEVRGGRLSRRTLDDYEQHWSDLQAYFGAAPMDTISQPVLLDYFDKRFSKDRGKREVNFIGLLCAWAKPRGRMQAPNPVDRGLRLHLKVTKRAKAPVVAADTYWVVWHCADQLVRDTLDLSYMVATRPAEALLVPMPPIGWTEMEVQLPKTKKSDRATKMVPQTPELLALVERRRKLHPHSLYVLFDEKGQQLRSNGAIRSRLCKARNLAEQVCKKAGLPWVDFTRQQLRPTAITQVDQVHGRDEARKLAGHSTERQTADYVRHEAERVQPAVIPAPSLALQAQVEKIKAELVQGSGAR